MYAKPIPVTNALFIFILSANNKKKKSRRNTNTLNNELSKRRSRSKRQVSQSPIISFTLFNGVLSDRYVKSRYKVEYQLVDLKSKTVYVK